LKKIKVLIVDDSVLFRSQIQEALKSTAEIEIVGTASNGKIAIEKMLESEVDLITLDLEMPILDGLSTIAEMKTKNIKAKVVVFSSQSLAGASKTLEAMHIGATDFVAKPVADSSNLTPAQKIKEALYPKIVSLFPGDEKSKVCSPTKIVNQNIMWETLRPEILVIASSTGGPNALVDFFSSLNCETPFPILIAQHMPPMFTTSLAERIAKCAKKVCLEAVHGEVLKPNQIYLAPGNFHMKINGDKGHPTLTLDQGPQRNFVRPCADYLFESATAIYGRHTLGVVLTGMGRDGAQGAEAIKQNHGVILIQNQESCVVFGMPGAVFEAGHYDYAGTPQEIASKIKKIASNRSCTRVA
jgi:two-component system chemotaxis response regulator CheB